MSKIVCLILARGGSKGISGKNIRNLNGKPLISYVIEEAKKLSFPVYVSSDSQEILDVSKSLGVNAIRRSDKNSQDDSKSIDAVQEFISKVDTDFVVLLNACCPLTKAEDIKGVIDMALETGADSVVSLVEDFSSHPSKVCRLSSGGSINDFGINFETEERQSLDNTYKRNAAIYMAKREVIESGTFFGEDTRGYVMPKERSLDINDEFDWKIAEFLIKNV